MLLATAGITQARLSFILRAIPLAAFGGRGAEAVNRIIFGKQPVHPDAVKFMNAIMTHFKARVAALPLLSDDELRGLSMPLLLVVGAKDALYNSAATAARLESLAPNLKVMMLPEMGHVLYGLSGKIAPFLTA